MAIESYGPISHNDPAVSSDEKKLIDLLDRLYDEGERARDKWAPQKDRKYDLALYRGEVGPQDAHFKGNFIKAFINRQCSQLTDNRPVPRVDAFKASAKGVDMRAVAHILKQNIRAVWDEADMQRQTFKLVHTAAIERAAGIATVWDHMEKRIKPEIIRIDQVSIDPNVVEAARLSTEAEYVFIDRIVPLAAIVAAFPGRGRLVKPDAAVSDLSPIDEKKGAGIMTPVDRLLGIDRRGPLALPRAKVRECWVKDRQKDAAGRLLFPSYRRLVKVKDLILWDGPNPYWDGEVAADWFDWEVDPNHLYGASEASNLREMQLAFNRIVSDTVNARLLSNILLVLYETGAITEKTAAKLQKIDGSLIIQKQGGPAKTLTMTPPPSVNADSLVLAKFIFTTAQLIAGVPDVVMGESPGSLQSGVAIEGLQEGANIMTRSRASRLEDLYGRVGQKLIARTFQFWEADRVVALNGLNDATAAYMKYRIGFFAREDGTLVTNEERHRSFADFKFSVLPGSSAPGSRMRRADMMLRLVSQGAARRQDALEAADMPNAEEMAKKGMEEAQAMAPAMQAMKNLGK